MQGESRTQRPPVELKGQGDLRTKVETSQQFRSMKAWFTSRKASQGTVKGPEEWGASKFLVYAGRIAAGSVEDLDGIECGRIGESSVSVRGLEEVLVALDHPAERKSLDRLGEEKLRFYFGVHCLGENVVEGQAEEKRTKVVNIGNRAEAVKVAVGRQTRLLATFLQWGSANAAINHTKNIQVYIGTVAGTRAELSALGPTAQREVFCPHRSVHAGTDCPVEGIADDIASGGRPADGRHEETRVPHFPGHRMSRVGKVKDRESMQYKLAVVDAGISSHIHNHFVGLEPPFGMRKFAGGDGAVVHQVVIRARLLHDFAGESEGSGRGKHHAVATETEARRRAHVEKAPALGCQVVGSVAGPNVVVVGAAVKSEMPGGRGLAAV